MTNEDLKAKLSEILPAITFEEGGQWLNLNVGPKEWLPFAENLRNNPDLNFDYLFCLTCVDWQTHLTMVYHFESTQYRHTIVVKSKLDRNKPEIETVSQIWRTADFHEREGKFPLRKDFEDPVNMIKL